MSNCPNCLSINPFKKVDKDGSVIEICENCNTIKEEEHEKYTENQVQNKEASGFSANNFIIGMFIIAVLFWTLAALLYYLEI